MGKVKICSILFSLHSVVTNPAKLFYSYFYKVKRYVTGLFLNKYTQR